MTTIPRTALWLLTAFALLPGVGSSQTTPEDFASMLSAAHRSAANVARDPYRHPAQTLAFFGVRPDSTVVEILPGSGGYYMEILAPYLQQKGLYISANRDESLPQYLPDHQKFLQRLKAEPALYGQVVVTEFRADRHAIAPAGSADFVISFRNLHNWMDQGELQESLRTFYTALKSGGVLGIVDHRGRTDQTQAEQMANGYVREDLAIQLIEQAGFRLDGRSEVNANPLDTKDHPEGVWTLPPTYRLKDKDREKYRAIGESDRFTLRFVKP
ncbi:MAG: methyltransferase [Betaproteobacteria bacterium]|nr:methyltransferase [Betaproteobacteria bacterium]